MVEGALQDLLNPSTISTFEDLEKNKSFNMYKVIEVVKKLLGSRAPEVDESCPEMLKTLDVVGL